MAWRCFKPDAALCAILHQLKVHRPLTRHLQHLVYLLYVKRLDIMDNIRVPEFRKAKNVAPKLSRLGNTLRAYADKARIGRGI